MDQPLRVRAVPGLFHRAGLRGVKFHPSLQAFAPDDPAYWPIFEACQEHGLLALFHTGTSGIGARQPGGQGIRIDYAHPLKLDPVAAAHPGLTVVAAHSSWSPRRIPPEVIRELRGRLSGQFVWGSDFPVPHPGTLPGRAGGPGFARRRAGRGAAA